MYNEELKTELMDWNGCKWVESVPDKMHGEPVLVDTRMPAESVLINFDEGMTIDELLEYGLDRTAVIGVLTFAGRLKQAAAA